MENAYSLVCNMWKVYTRPTSASDFLYFNFSCEVSLFYLGKKIRLFLNNCKYDKIDSKRFTPSPISSSPFYSIHSKIHVADFTFMVRRINENSHTLSAYVFLRWFHDSDHWFYASGAFYLKNNYWPDRDSNPRPVRTLFSIKTPNRNLAFSAMPLLENLTNNYQYE
jgi:hypothetical protein